MDTDIGLTWTQISTKLLFLTCIRNVRPNYIRQRVGQSVSYSLTHEGLRSLTCLCDHDAFIILPVILVISTPGIISIVNSV